MQQEKKSTAPKRKQGSETKNFNLKAVKKNPLKVWLRVGFISWPVVSVLFNLIPFLKKIIINKFLGKAEDFYAKVESIHLEVLKPGVTIKDIHFNKTDVPGGYVMESSAELIKISLDWKSLWSGIIICNADVHRLVFSFSMGKKTQEKKQEKNTSTRKKFEVPVPVIIRQFNVTDSKV